MYIQKLEQPFKIKLFHSKYYYLILLVDPIFLIAKGHHSIKIKRTTFANCLVVNPVIIMISYSNIKARIVLLYRLGHAKKDGYNRTSAIQYIRKRISVSIHRTPNSPTPLESSLNSLFNHVLIIVKRRLGTKL